MNHRKEILAKVESMPSMPPMVMEAMRLLQNPSADMAQLVRAVEYDPGLTANVLRLANSGLFGRPRSVHSVRDAIVRLGTRNIFQLLVTSVVFPLVSRPVKGYDLAPGQLWAHSVAVAVGVEERSRTLGSAPSPYAFTAALLHDIGKIVMGTFVELDVAPIMSLAHRERLSFEHAEQAVLGINHAEVGALTLNSWELPEEIVKVCRWHHEPDRFDGNTLVVDLVHVADAMCLVEGIGAGCDGLHYHVSPAVAARLNLKTDVAEPVICRILARLDDAKELLGTDVGR